MADEPKYTLAEARKIFEERAKMDRLHQIIHNQREQVNHLKGLNKAIKRAHQHRVTLTHRQDNHIAKLYDIIERLGKGRPDLVSEAKNSVKIIREEKRAQKADAFRASRRARRHRAEAKRSARLAQEASDRQKEAERVRLALEAKKAEESRSQPATRG
jgi:hypothetical protein